ncbi:XdhC family protein [uncultured Roseobacter sp.]|uniref:XdhC family protein n=1 Tax=uncultured Roseobacter sp. TaxID=114847 RepID=UPI002613B882|nr:XdhC family protein [uncultured Roseobacter sp.]
MTPAEILSDDFAEAAEQLRAQQEPFAFATIVRTAGATAAKPGAKALLSSDGTLVRGWLGGGCTRGAVKRAALAALQSGEPQLVSIAPEDLLAEKGLAPGDAHEGTQYARNGCPSRGTVDIFIEPCLPRPQLVVLGSSPVAVALRELAPQFDWTVTAAPTTNEAVVGQAAPAVVIATQGQGDLDALTSALQGPAAHIAFVGSTQKFSSLANQLERAGIDRGAIDEVKAPAGLDIGAVTPEEIALSILAELVQLRRKSVKRLNI